MSKVLKCPKCGTAVSRFNADVEKSRDMLIKKEINAMANVCGFTFDDIVGRSRVSELAMVRHLIILMCSEMFGTTLRGLGSLVNRNHATIIHAKDNANSLLGANDEMAVYYYDKIKEYYNN